MGQTGSGKAKAGERSLSLKNGMGRKEALKETEYLHNTMVMWFLQICRKTTGWSLKTFNICKIKAKSTGYSHFTSSVTEGIQFSS